ncbi:MAG: proteinase inhibitor I4 serpin [Acidobacteria bacterium]|nr:MAG: proteinase inhibitor I4 serpin [Acidobacteriota bacterium]
MRIFSIFLLIAFFFSFKTMAQNPNPVTSAYTTFGFKLFSEITNQMKGNVVYSPSSIAWCLSMVLNGAKGQTRDEIARALEVNGINLDDVNAAYSTNGNVSDPMVELDIANSLWGKQGIPFKKTFLDTNKRYYGAEVSSLNFDDPGSVQMINTWVKTKTRGKIDKIIDQIDAASVLFLINAVYFKGTWTHQFQADQTKNDTFTTASGTQKQVPFMHQQHSFRYYEEPDFQAMSLPYGEGRLSMYIFLPAKNIGITKFQSTLTGTNWEKWMSGFEKTEGTIALPKFRAEDEIDLNDTLKAIGIRSAFQPQMADFSDMVDSVKGNAFLSSVKHKAFAEVDEHGTEAAAVTMGEIQMTSVMANPKTFQMIVNRPFVFAIRDDRNGTLLFLGLVNDPS